VLHVLEAGVEVHVVVGMRVEGDGRRRSCVNGTAVWQKASECCFPFFLSAGKLILFGTEIFQ